MILVEGRGGGGKEDRRCIASSPYEFAIPGCQHPRMSSILNPYASSANDIKMTVSNPGILHSVNIDSP